MKKGDTQIVAVPRIIGLKWIKVHRNKITQKKRKKKNKKRRRRKKGNEKKRKRKKEGKKLLNIKCVLESDF